MEILYIHVKNYNKFQNQDLNFGGKYIFNYNPINKELNIIENELFIQDFFNDEHNDNEVRANITNITSIIGQNGTGKTSILKLIKDNFPSGFNAIKDPMIFAVEQNGKIKIYHDETIIIEKSNNENFKIDLFELNKKTEIHENVEFLMNYSIEDTKNTSFIYFSNIFDGSGGMDIDGLHDISTNHLIQNDYKKLIENKNISSQSQKSIIDTHLYEDIQRQVFFINLFKSKKLLPFLLPEELYFSIKFNYVGNNEKNIPVDKKLSRIVRELIVKIDDFKKHDDGIKYIFTSNLFISFINEIYNSYREVINIEKHFYYIENDFSINTMYSMLDKFIKHVYNEIRLVPLQKMVMNFKKLLLFINESKSIKVNNNSIYFFIGNNSKEFEKFMEIYIDSYLFRPYIDFYWRNLSSGEKALLNIYSRFFSLTKKVQKTEIVHENTIVLIDEGDVYLHPEWQKEFVKILIEYLPLIFNQAQKSIRKITRNIQIIFTTNSPIPASDLLNNNTIFLEKSTNQNGKNITIVKDSLHEQKQTFAANIHTLLSDSFFVKDGLIGSFASSKIDKIILQLINRVDLNSVNREKMRRLIYQIGEPIIKHKLIEMYNDRFNMEIHERLDKIEKNLGL